MAIDRIGKSAPPAAPPETGGPSRSPGATDSFAPLRATDAKAPVSAGAAHVTPAQPLDRLQAGQIDLDGYLDLKVDEATAHLSALPQVELDSIRAGLRDRLATDPTLVELVRTATGKVPPLSDDA